MSDVFYGNTTARQIGVATKALDSLVKQYPPNREGLRQAMRILTTEFMLEAKKGLQ